MENMCIKLAEKNRNYMKDKLTASVQFKKKECKANINLR